MRRRAGLSRWLILGGICLFTVFLYRDTLSLYFLGDDLSFLYYVANGVREGRSLSQLLDELISPPYRGGFFYRPFTVVSFWVNYILYKANPIGWHFTSLFLHLVNVLLLWRFVAHIAGGRLGRRESLLGGAAAAIFALRPSGPETIACLSGRNDELVLTGYLVALFAYLRAEGRWGRHYLLALGGFLFALGAKRRE